MNLLAFVSSLGHRKGPDHLALGLWGEKRAEKMLRRKGLKILGRRVRVGRHDELDLIARSGDLLVVVEVKTRSQEGLEPPRKSVTYEKQRRLSRAAVRYARRLRPKPAGIRFDIVEVIGSPGKPRPEIRHLPGAFGLNSDYRI
ncbi:MAG: YraN family protein [Verrucomicrobia bacterium]|nr:YraN family protein [Verrucomicrobiota bacterium]MCH8512840.1 YraN family protein [Kiritimatiellia bacterium]